MTAPRVHLDRDGAVAVLTLDHPASRNGLSPLMRDALMAAVPAAVDGGAQALVVTGAGGTFSAGSDVGSMLEQTVADRTERLERFQRFVASWPALDVPVLTAVEGAAAGGGVSLVLASDWAVAAEDAVFVGGWLTIGLVPDAGALWFLARTMGPKAAYDWINSTRRMPAAEAEVRGLVSASCAPGAALETAVERARGLLALPERALRATKLLAARTITAPDLSAFLAAEAAEQSELFGGTEHRRLVERFVERRGRA